MVFLLEELQSRGGDTWTVLLARTKCGDKSLYKNDACLIAKRES